MKKIYSAPVMYREAYIAEQYVAASDCGIKIQTPNHGHVQIKTVNGGNNGGGNHGGRSSEYEIHCAFTSSNCGQKATSCVGGQTQYGCVTGHDAITSGSNLNASTPSAGHNCHILSNNADAVYFAENYVDETCGAGVAALMGLSSFAQIEQAFS